MKKSLLFLASVALLASCSSDLLESESFQASNGNGKGVTFQIVDDAAATRGMIDTDPGDTYHDAFFFAEKDRISVWARNAQKNYSPTTQLFTAATPDTWANVFSEDPVIYKATSSKGNPNYTSIDDANMLGLVTAPDKSDFFVAYPYTDQTVADAGGGEFTITPHKNLLTQSMNGYMNIDSRLMYGYAGGQSKGTGVKEGNKSVGEKVDMTLTSPLSTILFKYTNLGGYTAGISTDELGQLQDVTITSWTTPLVPAFNGQEIQVQNPDLMKIDNKWYVKSDLSVKYKTYSETLNYVFIGPNCYVKSTCSQEGNTWHVTDKSVEITTPLTTTEDLYTRAVSGWKINPGATDYAPATVLAGTAKVNITADGTFTYNTSNKTATYNKPANQPLTWKAGLDVSASPVLKDAEMNLFVLPVNRNGGSEKYTVTFNFKNADLVEERTVTADFEANTGTRTFTLNIAQRFPYIVTKGADAAADRTLYINSSKDAEGNEKKVRSIINSDGSVNWLDQFVLEKVDKSLIKKVVIKSGVDNLEKADWDALNRLTSVEELVIENNTEELLNVTGMAALKRLYANNVTKVNKGAFNATNGANITDLYLKKVTTFPKITNSGFTFSALQHLNLHSYEFGESQKEDIDPAVFFNSNTQSTLIDVDLSAVKSLAPLYAYTRTILFKNYSALVGITLNNEQVIFTQDEFKDCPRLTYVDGVCDIEVSTSAFENCTSLQTVHIYGDKIRANAFKRSGVKSVYKGAGFTKAQPVYVGDNAFNGNTAIQCLDLTKATEIGEYAFYQATMFGYSGYTRDVVTLNVKKVKKHAFDGTQVKRFQLMVAEETEEASLNSTAVTQIKYMWPDLNPAKISPYQSLDNKASIEIFGYNADDMDIFIPGYKTYTVETAAWTTE